MQRYVMMTHDVYNPVTYGADALLWTAMVYAVVLPLRSSGRRTVFEQLTFFKYRVVRKYFNIVFISLSII